jgi:hypothetical protein
MSAANAYSTEEERREATQLAGERSDEGQEASLREETHHHRATKYVEKGGEAREAQGAQEAEGGQTGEASKGGSHQPHRHKGDTAADIAQHDRELHGVRDSTKLDAVHRCAAAWLSRSA